MKTLIAVVATIVLGVIIYGWILGSPGNTNSMQQQGSQIFQQSITEMQTIAP